MKSKRIAHRKTIKIDHTTMKIDETAMKRADIAVKIRETALSHSKFESETTK